jgi:hypothetical protein
METVVVFSACLLNANGEFTSSYGRSRDAGGVSSSFVLHERRPR